MTNSLSLTITENAVWICDKTPFLLQLPLAFVGPSLIVFGIAQIIAGITFIQCAILIILGAASIFIFNLSQTFLIRALKQEIQKLQQENDQLKTFNSDLLGQVQKLGSEKTELNDRVTSLSRTNEELRLENEKLADLNKNLQQKLEEKDQALQVYQTFFKQKFNKELDSQQLERILSTYYTGGEQAIIDQALSDSQEIRLRKITEHEFQQERERLRKAQLDFTQKLQRLVQAEGDAEQIIELSKSFLSQQESQADDQHHAVAAQQAS